MPGSPYYKILGLPNLSDDGEVRKRFRSLAKKYHPDKNPDPKATEEFIKILDAYERIMKKDFSSKIVHTKKPKENTKSTNAQADFHRKAWERYERMRRQQEQELTDYYTSFTVGKKMKYKKVISVISFIVFLCLVYDMLGPTHNLTEKVESYSVVTYQSIGGDYVNEIRTHSGKNLFVSNYNPRLFEAQPKITLIQSALCRLCIKIHHTTSGKTISGYHPIHFTFYWARWIFIIFLLIGIVMPFIKKRSLFLVLGSWISMYITSLLLLIFLIKDFRIVSILSLGNWP